MSTARLYKTEAIVLRQRRLGEADRFVTLYTPVYGKLDAKAKGVRKTTSRMSGHLQPLTRCMLQLAHGHANDVVAGCETLESFQKLRDDLDLLSRALYVAELVDRMTPEHAPSIATYRLLAETLRRLETSVTPDITVRHFEMKLLDQSGFRPELECCVNCRNPLRPEEHSFAPLSGGVVCPSCASGLPGVRSLTLNALKVLRLLQRAPYAEVAAVRVDEPLALEIERHLRSYVVCVLERDLNAAAFIDTLRRRAAPDPVEV